MKINEVVTEAAFPKVPNKVNQRTPASHKPAKFDIAKSDLRYPLYNKSIQHYTAGSKLINSTLHQLYRAKGHPKIGEFEKAQIQMLDDAMYNHPLKKDMTLYHGTIQSPSVIWEQSKTSKNKPVRLHMPAYTSTSTDIDQAQDFAKMYKGYKNILVIHAPAGTPGISLRAFSKYPVENEVLLARDIELEVQPNPKVNELDYIVQWQCTVVGYKPKEYFE